MNTLGFATCVAGLLISSMPGPLREQQFEYNKQAEFDADGNIYVSSDQGKLIRMADPKHFGEQSSPPPSFDVKRGLVVPFAPPPAIPTSPTKPTMSSSHGAPEG